MATNDFLPFGGAAGANVMTQASYAALAARTAGFSAGTANSAQLNKVWRQSSIMSAALAQMISDNTGLDVLDDGSITTILANMKKSVSGRLLNVQVFSTAGTFTYTPTPGTTSVVVEVQGAGGGSGGLAATGGTTGAASGGGSAGAYAQARLTTGLSGATVTVGAKGAGGAAGANNGSAGGSSSFGALVTAPGGPGSQGGAAAAPPAAGISGAASAAPTGGNIYQNIGAAASSSLLAGLSAPIFGPGASTKFGCGQRGNSSSATVNAVGFGVGGGGCVNGISTAAQIGADGSGGIVIVWEYA